MRLAVRRLGGKNQDGVINQLKNKGYVFASNDNNQSGNGLAITVRRSWIFAILMIYAIWYFEKQRRESIKIMELKIANLEGKMDFKNFKKNFNKYQPVKETVFGRMSKEQKEFLIMCRDNNTPITFSKMKELWFELGWGYISDEAIRKRYIYLKNQRGKK